MARFRATIQGQRGMASRLGSTSSGLVVEANGWNEGIEVRAYVSESGRDTFEVYRNGGSNGRGSRQLIAVVS